MHVLPIKSVPRSVHVHTCNSSGADPMIYKKERPIQVFSMFNVRGRISFEACTTKNNVSYELFIFENIARTFLS